MMNNVLFLTISKNRIVVRLFFCLFILLSVAGTVCAACNWEVNTGMAASCASTDVAVCVSDASIKTGEITINLPACNISSSDTVTINMASGFQNVTSLSIIGNGAMPSIGSAEKTVIKRGTASAKAFHVVGVSSKKFRIANIKITGGSGGYNGVIGIYGTSKPSSGGGFRIDHMTLGDNTNPIKMRALDISGHTYGVIDSNISVMYSQFALVKEESGGNASWNRKISLGTDNAVYLEDNLVTNIDNDKNWMFCDGDSGGRIVVRNNTINGLYIGGHDAASTPRGVFSYEAYNNVLDMTLTCTSCADPAFNLRGGTNIIYNNTILKSGPGNFWGPILSLRNYRSLSKWGYITPWGDSCGGAQAKACLGSKVSPKSCRSDADCGGEAGSCQYLDGDEDATGYPCRDQIGITNRGTSQFDKHPSLFWNNTYVGKYYAPVVPDDLNNAVHIRNNRDYCHHPTTMPASCGGIETNYSAYAYPHPLRSSQPSDPDTSISAPKGFRISK